MSTPTLILGNNKWAIEEDNILGYAVEDRNGLYLPREISFTRGSDATYTDSTGIIRRSPWNLCLQSENFTSTWSMFAGPAVTPNAGTAPNGTQTATILNSAGGGNDFLYQNISTTVGATYTQTLYVKNINSSNSKIWTAISATPVVEIYWSGATITSVVGVGVTSSYTSVGDGWYRVILTYVATTTTLIFRIYSDSLNTSKSIYIWGAQLVEGSNPLPYLRTTDRLNVPRVDSSTGSKAFLVEPQRTNLLLNTVFDGTGSTPTSWSRPGGTGSSLLTTSTLGSGVQACLQSATSQRPFLQQDYTVAINTTYTFSMYIESISGTINYNNVMYLTNLPAGATTAYYLNNNLVDEGSQAQVGRLTIRVTIGAASSLVAVRCGIGTISNSTATILFSRPQFEVGSYQTTYIPTQATTVTRIADSAVKTGISSLIGQSEGTLFVMMKKTNILAEEATVQLDNGTTNTRISINFAPNSSTVTRLNLYSSLGGTFYAYSDSLTTPLQNMTKVAVGYALNDLAFYANGIQIATDNSFPIFTSDNLNRLLITVGLEIAQIIVFPTRLTNAELAALTTL